MCWASAGGCEGYSLLFLTKTWRSSPTVFVAVSGGSLSHSSSALSLIKPRSLSPPNPASPNCFVQDRKDASQQQNRRIKKQASLQARRKQENQQKDRRKRELLALTFGGQQVQGKVGRQVQSESSDNMESRQAQHHHHHKDIANVHGGDAHSELSVKQRREEAERLERVRQVEQTTVHTVITTHEKIHNMAATKHLPAITTAKQEDPLHQVHVHGAAQTAAGDQHRQRAMRGSGGHGHDHYERGERGGHDRDHYVKGVVGRSGSITGSGSETQGHNRPAGVHHLKSLIKTDSPDSRAGQCWCED